MYQKKLRLTLLTLMGIVMMLSPFCLVHCESNLVMSISQPTAKDVKSITDLVSNVNEEIKSKDIEIKFLIYDSKENKSSLGVKDKNGVYSSGYLSLGLDTLAYNDLTQKDKETVMSIALSDIDASSISRTNKNKIYNFVADSDTGVSSLVRQLSNDVHADYVSAYSKLRPFKSTFGTLMGLIVIAIFLVLGLTMLIDIAYMTLAPVQSFLNEQGKDKAKFVSIEAYSAVKESYSGSEYKNPLGIYMHRKVAQLIILSICVLYLASGKIYDLVGVALDAVSVMLGM